MVLWDVNPFHTGSSFIGRACSKPFQTGFVIGAEPLIGVLGIFMNHDMTHLRMKHPVMDFAINDIASTDACAYGDVEKRMLLFVIAEGDFPKCSSADICGNLHGDIQTFFQTAQNIKISPVRFWGGCDISVFFLVFVQLQWTKASDAKGIKVFIFEKIQSVLHGFLWSSGRDGNLLKDLSFLISDGQNKFCASCFNCAKSHEYTS